MGTAIEHCECANRTQKTIAHLLSDRKTHSPWIAIAAFYKSIHVLEALFTVDSKIRHTTSHEDRDRALKNNRKYNKIYAHFRELKSAARNARYLSNCSDFDDYLSPDQVVDKLLKHHLHQIEKSAAKTLGPTVSFDSISSLFPAPPPTPPIAAATPANPPQE